MFELPLFLLAALGGAMIPLLLHMMQKRRSLPIPFPTLRFLQLAQKASSRRIRIEHLLLWLLRTLIMLLLGSAFAMPVLRSGRGGGFFGRAPRDIAIVLDVSYSMGYLTGRDTVFDRALDMAVDLVDGLAEGDRFCIYLAGEKPQALIAEPISDKTTGTARLRALKPTFETSRLLPAVAAAREALRQTSGRRPQELHILTDNQELAWGRGTLTGSGNTAEGEAAGGDHATAEAAASDRRLTYFVTLAGVAAPENITPRLIELQPVVLFKDSGAQLTVELGHSGSPRETTVTFYLNGQEHARRAVTAGTPQGGQVVFPLPPLPPGIHTGRVECPADNLAADDAFHFLIRVRPQMPTLVCGGERDTFFLRAALRAAAGGEAAFTAVEPEALAGETLSGYSTVFLCNALPLSGQAMAAVDAYVRRGGLLVLFPGFRAAVADYRAWASLPGVPREVRELPRNASRQTLLWTAARHPVLRTLDGALTTPVIAMERGLVWDETAADTQPIITLSSGDPLLLERPSGDGRVMLFAVSADRAWSNFPLTPFYLPLIAQLVEYGAGLGANAPFVWGGGMLPLATVLPEAGPEIALTGPDGRPATIRRVLQDGQMLGYIEDATLPGIYLQSGASGPQPALAVNMPREESDLTPVAPDALAALLGVESLHTAFDRESLAALLHDHRVGRTYGELLLWLVLLLLAAEFVYANRLARGSARLSEQLTLDSSGRIRGHLAAALAGSPEGEGQ